MFSMLFDIVFLTTLTTALIPLPNPVIPSMSLPPPPTSPLTARINCYTIPPHRSSHGRTALLPDCYTAVRLVLAERSIIEPQHFNRSAPVRPGIINVPYQKHYKSCLFILDSMNPVDEADFFLIRAAYYAAELIQPCVARQKTPLGGQVMLDVGDFFVSIVGLEEAEGVEEGKSGGRQEYIDGVMEEVRLLARGQAADRGE